jgi:hypothetical protein
MTTSLDSYLRGAFKEDCAFLRRLTDTIDEVIPIFCSEQTKLPRAKAEEASVESWPYAVVRKKAVDRTQPVSWSTHSMILFALDAFRPRDKAKHSILIGEGFRPPKLPSKTEKKLWRVIDAAKKTLVEMVNHSSGRPLTTSGTYGEDDPFTLTWLTEILFRWIDQPDVTRQEFAACRDKTLGAGAKALERGPILETGKTRFNEVPGAFLKVRRLHLAIATQRLSAGKSSAEWIEKQTPNLWAEFDDTIHRQLSYSSMGEQKFDPAELAFALEGALLLHPNWVGRSTVDQVFEALKLSRDRHPFWRPLTPFLANDRGHVLFLISIEVANSILRACEVLHKEGDPNRFSQFEAQLRTYSMWLLGEMEEIHNPAPDEPNLVGWRTEYESNRDTIQLWHTSHVLVFLVHYAALLKRKIAAGAVEAAGLQTRLPKRLETYWQSEPLLSLSVGQGNGDGERPYAVLQRIKKHYIEPRQERPKDPDGAQGRADSDAQAPPLYSMLLYGPPGTGKTTVAEQLAASLQRPLIIITVSDFLAAGAAEIENRAKGVFEVLCAQEEVIILFDEIDQFLLDRNSDFYHRQADIFKFMTPGMLTKLQDLRDAKNCIFVVATNYYERIDSAIKRRGRIDEHFLLSVPDQKRRRKIFERFVIEVLEGKFADIQTKEAYRNAATESAPKQFLEAILSKEPDAELANLLQTADNTVKDILEKTVLFGWGDLKNVVESQTKFQPGMDINSLVASLREATGKVDSAVSLSLYQRRFEGEGPFPFEEFFLLLYLLAESNKKLSQKDRETIGWFLAHMDDFYEETFDLKEKGIKDNLIFEKVRSYLQENGCKAKRLQKKQQG